MRWLAVVALLMGWACAAPLQVSVSSKGRVTTVEAKHGSKLVWQQRVPYGLAKGWGVTGNTVWLGLTKGSADYRVMNFAIGLRLSDGKDLWNINDVYAPLYTSSQVILFRKANSGFAWPDLHQQRLIAVNAVSGAQKELNFTLPGRPGCGEMNDESYTSEGFMRFKADAKYFYAYVTDACGVFMARFDWHGSAKQKPVIKAV